MTQQVTPEIKELLRDATDGEPSPRRRSAALVGAVVGAMLVVLVLGVTPCVFAECFTLRDDSPSQRLARSRLAFVGEVLAIDTVLQPDSFQYRVTFRVDEAFRGITSGEQILAFTATAESFKFAVSQHVLVYATSATSWRDMYATECSATRIVTSDDTEVRALRELVFPLRVLPPCGDTETRSTSDWQRVSYKRVELLLPPSLEPILVQIEGDHRDWVGDGLSVSLSVGYTGPHSYDLWNGNRCRVEIEGEPALVIEQVSAKDVSISVWTPAITTPIPTPYHPFVTARSGRREDMPLLRTIILSLKMADP